MSSSLKRTQERLVVYGEGRYASDNKSVMNILVKKQGAHIHQETLVLQLPLI